MKRNNTPFIGDNLLKRAIPSARDRHWLFKKMKTRIPQLGLLSILQIANSFCSVYFALVSKELVNTSITGDKDGFISVLSVFGVLILLQIISGTYAYNIQEKLLYTIDGEVKQSVFHDIISSDYSQISRHHSVDLLHRINADVNTVVSNTISIVTSLSSFITSLLAASIALFSLAPLFTLFIIPLCILLSFIAIYCQRNLKSIQKDVSRSSSNLSSFYQEAIEKLLIVQGLDISSRIEEKSDILLSEKIGTQKKRKNLQVKVNLAYTLLTTIGSFITMVWCAFKVLVGEIDYGTLVAITSLVSMLQGPLLSLPLTVPSFIALTASLERILEVVDSANITSSSSVNLDKTNSIKSITFKNISFEYPNQEERKFNINNVSFSINAHGMTVITGNSGCGKSTILKLILGLYKPTHGELLLECCNGNPIPIDRSTRGLFAFAPQGNLILSGTIKENIMISNPNASDDDLTQAIYVSAMDSYISELPQGLETILGENGAGLSEGQIQRINIARAVISGAPILLLDEVTSSLDIDTERIVLERICSLSNRACIAVTHRVAALELADYHIHFSEGKVEQLK